MTADFVLEIYNDAENGVDVVSLQKDNPAGSRDPVLCRIQLDCIHHIFHDDDCDCREQIKATLDLIGQCGKPGLLLYIRPRDPERTDPKKGEEKKLYDAAAHVLTRLGIKSVDLLSLDYGKAEALKDCGITVAKSLWPDGTVVRLGRRYSRIADKIDNGSAESPVPQSDSKPCRVLIVGDLNIDKLRTRSPAVGGSGFFPAVAFQKETEICEPVVFGKIGDDEHGRMIENQLRSNKIWSTLGTHPTKKSGYVKFVKSTGSENLHDYEWDTNNANDYDPKNLEQAIKLLVLGDQDYVYLSSYMFVQKNYNLEKIAQILQLLSGSGARVILDLTRMTFEAGVQREASTTFDKEAFSNLLGKNPVHCVICQKEVLETIGYKVNAEDKKTLEPVHKATGASWLILRYKHDMKRVLSVSQRYENRMINHTTLMLQAPITKPKAGMSDRMVVRVLKGIIDMDRANRL